MNSFTPKKAFWLSVVLVLWTASTAFAQPSKPLLQPITVHTENPDPAPTPLVKKTGSSVPTTVDTVNTGLDAVNLPGYTGILIEKLDGEVIKESYSNSTFNPASNVKLATAYAVLKTFGPDFRFSTGVWTDGQIDRHNGVLIGNLYVTGRDPVFTYENAVAVAHELNFLGIKQVTGDLIVTDNFVMNYSASPQRSGSTLMTAMDSAKRPAAANTAWQKYLVHSKNAGKVQGIPTVSFGGSTYVQPVPTNVRLMFSHESPPMREILKVTLAYSNNFLSERLGDMVGGPYAVARIVHTNANVPPQEFYLETASGLGINRVTPGAMMKLLRALRKDLDKFDMTFTDIMPVAGIDPGTLESRFDSPFSRGSLVGKTGTLGRTDGGVSSLCGEINTRKGKILFVIFNQRGNVNSFRAFQNSFVDLVQNYFGGAVPVKFDPTSLEARMSKIRISYPIKYNE